MFVRQKFGGGEFSAAKYVEWTYDLCYSTEKFTTAKPLDLKVTDTSGVPGSEPPT